MRFLTLLPAVLLAAFAAAQDATSDAPKAKKLDYQSDVARMRQIVINSLYSHKEIFLRELISNSNDALEKLRLTALADKSLDVESELNVTIRAFKDESGPGGRIVITDTGIGMTPEELTANLGTLAKSGTSEFLKKAKDNDGTGNGQLIGQFGVGFYSSFLVADSVKVASIKAKSDTNPSPVQTVFASSADDSTFEIYEDPRGNTLERGTEITLYLKKDAYEYLSTDRLRELVSKHSSFATSFPIYLFTQRDEAVPIEKEEAEPVVTKEKSEDDEEAIVEDVTDEGDASKSVPETKIVTIDEWLKLNGQEPLWMRNPADVKDEEYEALYMATFKDYEAPLAWTHFSGDSGSGVSFKALIYIPSNLPEEFWQTAKHHMAHDIRLLVKHVFITSDLGSGTDALPKWASWVKVIVDAEDLPLNVSRETLQNTRFLRQIKQTIIKRLITLFGTLAEKEDKFAKLQETYASVLKLASLEETNTKNKNKLITFTRFATNQRKSVSLDEYLEGKKEGQKQIFYLAEVGKTPEELSKSVFVEKLHARGYEVLLLVDPLDEILLQNTRQWKKLPFQDVAKTGLKFGDEDTDAEGEKEEQAALTEQFKPLLDWLKPQVSEIVRDVVISNRLVSSPCAVVADLMGYTANVQKLMNASNKKEKNSPQAEFAKKQKLLEINPKSPLIQGLLRRVESLPTEGEAPDLDAEEELKEVANILIDGALVRSGFEVPDSNAFFTRVDRVLRRSLGVAENAKTDTTVKPAPPVDSKVEEEDQSAGENVAEMFNAPPGVDIRMEEVDEFDNVVEHDEL